MSDDMKEKLRELINTQGQQIFYDPRKFTSNMLDLCLNTHEREIKILATALTEKIPQHLQSSGGKLLTEDLRSNLTNRLEKDCALQADAAKWAVNTWAEALGMVTGVDNGTKDAGKQVPPPELKTTIQTQPEVKPVESPVIGLDCKMLNFGEVVPGMRPLKSFQVHNGGMGVLKGKAITAEPWIELYPKIINASGVGQTIAVTINSALIPSEKRTVGYINIESNGGTTKIEIRAKAATKLTGIFKTWMIASGIIGMLAIIGMAVQACPPNRGQEYVNKYLSYSDRGNAYYEKGDYDLAIADYTKAIEQQPKVAVTYSSRCAAYTKIGYNDKAIADCNKSIEIDPTLENAYRWRGDAYANKSEYPKAIVDYNRAIELNQLYASAYYGRGVAYEHIGEYSQAKADIGKATELGFTIAQKISVTTIIAAFLFLLLGLCWGSLLNWLASSISEEGALQVNSPFCRKCKVRRPLKHNIPLIGYFLTKGICPNCRAPVPRRIPIVEFVTGVLFVLLYLVYGISWELGILLFYSSILIVLCVTCIEHLILPNIIIYPGAIVAAFISIVVTLVNYLLPWSHFWARSGVMMIFNNYLLSVAASGLVGALIMFLMVISSRGSIGMGNVKLAGLLGLMVGYPLAQLALFVGLIVSLFVVAFLIITRRKGRKDMLPLGSFLCVGGLVTFLWGPQVIVWTLAWI